MSGELGLLNNYKKIIGGPLRNFRGQDSNGGRDIDLETFCQKHAKNLEGGLGLKNTAGLPLTMEDIWQDLGMDPARTSLDNLLTLSDDVKYFAPEVVRTYINLGLRAKPWYDRLCAATVDVSGQAVVSPWILYDNEGMEVTGEGETIGEASLEWGHKMVTLQKKAKSIVYSDEVMFGCTLPQIQPFLERIGIQLAASLNKQAVSTLVNGDQASGDECAVVGATTQNAIAFADFVRAWARGDMLYYEWESMVTSEIMANKVLNLSEFSRPQGFGTTLVALDPVERVIPDRMPHFTSSAMPANQILLVDPSLAMMHLSFVPLRVEYDRIAERQLNGTYCSVIDGFTTIDRRARVIIDISKVYAAGTATDFPSWMTPLN